MSKLEITKKVSETNNYSNMASADRSYDVEAKVTIGEGEPIINEGAVKLKGGDVVVAAFTKSQYDSLRISFAGVEIPKADAINAIITDVCAYINELKQL